MTKLCKFYLQSLGGLFEHMSLHTNEEGLLKEIGTSSAISKPISPLIIAEPGDGKVTLRWNAVSGATKYAVSRWFLDSSNNESYEIIADNLTIPKYTVEGLTNGVEYEFLVQSYTTYWSPSGENRRVRVTPIAPFDTTISSTHTVWCNYTGGDVEKTFTVPTTPKMVIGIYNTEDDMHYEFSRVVPSSSPTIQIPLLSIPNHYVIWGFIPNLLKNIQFALNLQVVPTQNANQ